MDGTEDEIIWEEDANDGDSDGDLLYPELEKELCAVFDEESIDEDFLKSFIKPKWPFSGQQIHKTYV